MPLKSEFARLLREAVRVSRLMAVLLVLLALPALGANQVHPQSGDQDRIVTNAKINGNPVRLIVDTGFEAPFVLFSGTARKLHLRVTPPRPDTPVRPGEVRAGWTKPQKLSIEGNNIESPFYVLEMPAFLKPPADEAMGWPAFCKSVLNIDCLSRAIYPLTNSAENIHGWHAYWLHTNSDQLVLELPCENPPTPVIVLDTGSTRGVSLNPEKWRAWKTSHTKQVMTMDSYYTPNPGIVVSEEGWADKILLGDLELTDVPVSEANSSEIALASSPKTRFVATLGFAALKRLDIVVDGSQGAIWLRPKKTPPTPYGHNRLGAVFAPKDLQSDEWIAHVANGTPAFEAGIRNGDVLWGVGKHGISSWWHSTADYHLFYDSPPGTKIDLTFRRNGHVFKTTATLRNLLPPNTSAHFERNQAGNLKNLPN